MRLPNYLSYYRKGYLLSYASNFIGKTVWRAGSVSSYHVSIKTHDPFAKEWLTKPKKLLAEHLTLNTRVPTEYSARQETPYNLNRTQHEAVKYLTYKYYHPKIHDAVDSIPVHCAEHLALMRMAVGIARNPEPNSLKIAHALAEQLYKLLSILDKKTLRSIFTIGVKIHESRSKELINNIDQWMFNLKNHKHLPPNKLLRILETVISPLALIIVTHGSHECLLTKALNNRQDIGHLEDFILSIISHFKPYHMPYIKGPDGPFFHLKSKQYVDGEKLNEHELVTLSHYLENCQDCEDNPELTAKTVAQTPVLNQVKIIDPTSRSHLLHIGYNVPHYFDVSGTTGTVMQAILGLLHLAGQSHLLSTPEEYRKFGMIFTGCNFTKQGYHNFYEIFPTLEWGVENVYKERGLYHLKPAALIDATGRLLKQCVDPSSKMAPIITDAVDVVNEHNCMHYEIYKKQIGKDIANVSIEIKTEIPDQNNEQQLKPKK